MPNWAKLVKILKAGTKEASEMMLREGAESGATRELAGKIISGKEIASVAKDTAKKDMRIIRFSDGEVWHARKDAVSDMAATTGGTRSIREKIPRGKKGSPSNVAVERFNRNYKKAYFGPPRKVSIIKRDLAEQQEMARRLGYESTPYEILMAPDGVPVPTPITDVDEVLRSGQATRLRKGQRRGQK